MRSTYKKPLALLLSAALSFTLSGSPVYASNSRKNDDVFRCGGKQDPGKTGKEKTYI